MRASRLVQLLLLLQTRGRLTAPELAAELEVSVRTIYRDLGALSAAGVPSPAAELGLGTVLAAAQLKVLAALPPELRSRATLAGPVLDLGCGPGHWTSYLHSLGADVSGVEMVPEFVEHARASHPELVFRQGSMTELDIPDHSVAGILSWYSTIHLSPSELDRVLTEFRRLLAPSGVLVAGFFDSEDCATQFDHKVITAYRWPADVFSARLTRAGFVEVERLRRQDAERPYRRYAAIAARAS